MCFFGDLRTRARMKRKRARPARKFHHDRTEITNSIRMSAAVPPGRNFHDEYEMTPYRIGGGAGGEVYLALTKNPDRHTLSGTEAGCHLGEPLYFRRLTSRTKPVAVKLISRSRVREEDLEHVLEEVNIYLEMDHPNIARLFRVFCQKNALILVMEHCSGGSLAERLLRRSRFSEDEARLAVVQILRAVHYCHHHPHVSVCHRDLKPLNCVYENPSDDAALKLVDFGLAQLVRQHSMLMSGKAGTLHFMAPEVVWNKRPYNNKCDLWSVGVIAYSLLCGYPPFHGDRCSFTCGVECAFSTSECCSSERSLRRLATWVSILKCV